MDVCPCNVIGISENDELYIIPERESICQRCGQCMAVCNTKSIIVNDFGYDSVFSRQIETYGSEGDIAFGISTSGNSQNT